MLQQQAVVHSDSATILINEGDKKRKEVVHEHHWHTTSTTEVLVRMGRPCVMLATCTRWGWLRSVVAWLRQLISGETSSRSRANTGTRGSRRVSGRLELSENQP